MRNNLLLAAFPLALSLSSCGSKGPEKDAEKLCDMMKDWKEARDAGKAEEADRIEAAGKKMRKELREKYRNDKEGSKVVEEKMDACKDEVEGR